MVYAGQGGTGSGGRPLNSIVRPHRGMVEAISINDEMAAVARSRIENLRSKSFPELRALPESDEREETIRGKAVIFTVYRSDQPDGSILVVIQAHRERWLGLWANVSVFGFIASADGRRTEAPERLLWDYS